jgi:hypothetical protein
MIEFYKAMDFFLNRIEKQYSEGSLPIRSHLTLETQFWNLLLRTPKYSDSFALLVEARERIQELSNKAKYYDLDLETDQSLKASAKQIFLSWQKQAGNESETAFLRKFGTEENSDRNTRERREIHNEFGNMTGGDFITPNSSRHIESLQQN